MSQVSRKNKVRVSKNIVVLRIGVSIDCAIGLVFIVMWENEGNPQAQNTVMYYILRAVRTY